ncbi:hypothetical protein FNV43_RR03423 [Rhamnella rubrinervis]|uniref:Ribosome biogenesis regulatory protein n=1 Tax=Rhamnella rubrinervis TaxID=2594499 RepID=A0A8K0MPL7_9ROSA|nr:hypothetical protein FNV43_RR03423 [Rhamnella rubrinervis]
MGRFRFEDLQSPLVVCLSAVRQDLLLSGSGKHVCKTVQPESLHQIQSVVRRHDSRDWSSSEIVDRNNPRTLLNNDVALSTDIDCKRNPPVTYAIAARETQNVKVIVLPCFGLSEGINMTAKKTWSIDVELPRPKSPAKWELFAKARGIKKRKNEKTCLETLLRM